MDRHEALTLMEELSSEHMMVLNKLKTIEGLLEDSQEEKVMEILSEIKGALEIHFKKEENALFPFLDGRFKREMKRMGGPIRPVGGPIQVMLAEHRLIMQAVDELHRGKLSEKVRRFILLQRSHIFREDVILFKAAVTLLKLEG